MTKYVIASSKEWFELSESHLKSNDDFIYFEKKEQLIKENLEKIEPRYIFFPHWNWLIDEEIYNNFECIVFHTAPLPYGRGGSPIQNLIVRGFNEAPVCALRVDGTVDGGAIYLKQNVSLSGTLSQIFSRINLCINQQIKELIHNEISPKEQEGEVVTFKRLKALDNEIPENSKLNEFYDRVRMLDHPEYPNSYIQHGNMRIEFENCFLEGREIRANVRVKNAD